MKTVAGTPETIVVVPIVLKVVQVDVAILEVQINDALIAVVIAETHSEIAQDIIHDTIP